MLPSIALRSLNKLQILYISNVECPSNPKKYNVLISFVSLTLDFYFMDHINAPFEERDEEPVGVLQEYIKNLRPWTEFFNPKSFSTTQNSTDAATGTWHKSALKRIQTNFSYYLSNYSILPLILCSLTLM